MSEPKLKDYISKECWNNGNPFTETTYRDGQLHGIVKAWHQNGNLYYEDPYQNGNCHGVSRGWYEDGRLSYEIYYLYGVEVTQEEYRKHELIERLAKIK